MSEFNRDDHFYQLHINHFHAINDTANFSMLSGVSRLTAFKGTNKLKADLTHTHTQSKDYKSCLFFHIITFK